MIAKLCDTLIDARLSSAASATSSAISPRRCRWRSSATCSECCPEEREHVPQVVRRSGQRAEQHTIRRTWNPGGDGRVRRLHRIHDGHDRGAQGRADRRPGQRPGHAEVEGTAEVRRRDRHRGPAAPDRRRRDHPAHTVRRNRAIAAAPRSARALVNGPGVAAERDRRDAALDRTGEEHGAHDHRRHRVSRHCSCTQGEKIILLFESANFDETVFDDPENFDIERYPNNHLAFGFGTHFCLGNQLARLELSIMQTRLLQAPAGHAAGVRCRRCRCGRRTSSAVWRRCRWLHPERAAADSPSVKLAARWARRSASGS